MASTDKTNASLKKEELGTGDGGVHGSLVAGIVVGVIVVIIGKIRNYRQFLICYWQACIHRIFMKGSTWKQTNTNSPKIGERNGAIIQIYGRSLNLDDRLTINKIHKKHGRTE